MNLVGDPEAQHAQEHYNYDIDKIRDEEYPQLQGDTDSF